MGIGEVRPDAATFTDVPPDKWYYGAVEAACQAGLIKGIGAGRFAPEREINRAELVVLVARALKKAGADPAPAAGEAAQLIDAFKDKAEIPGWAAADVASAVKAGVVKGMPDGAFAPLARASRAEATVMLKRMLGNLGKL
jgi:hypothetical protein